MEMLGELYWILGELFLLGNFSTHLALASKQLENISKRLAKIGKLANFASFLTILSVKFYISGYEYCLLNVFSNTILILLFTRNLHFYVKILYHFESCCRSGKAVLVQAKPSETVETDKKIIYFYISPFM